jgi:hypothetical protein
MSQEPKSLREPAPSHRARGRLAPEAIPLHPRPDRPERNDSPRFAATLALGATLGLATAAWIVTLQQMNGMDMGVGTQLGSFGSFLATWVPMMAAMMLPGAAPAVVRRAQGNGWVGAVLPFLGSYLAIWAAVGIAVFVLYRPHGTLVAGALVLAAGIYELTPLKQSCRRRCQERVRSGLEFGLYCVGSTIGLMLILIAVGVMSLAWMAVIAVLIVAQKLLPPRAAVDVPLSLAILGLGILILVAPRSIPGLTPAM